MALQITNAGSGDPRDVVIVYHGGLSSSLAPEATIITDNHAGFQRLYESTGKENGISTVDQVLDFARSQLGDFQVKRLFLVGFSEGVQGVRAQLHDGVQPFATVAIDGTHTASNAQEMAAQLAPWRDQVNRARAGDGVFIASHSAIIPSGYESTTATLRRITGFDLQDRGDVPDCVKSQDGNVIVYSCNGSTAADHVAQAKYMLPKLFSEAYGIDSGGVYGRGSSGGSGSNVLWIGGTIALCLAVAWWVRQ